MGKRMTAEMMAQIEADDWWSHGFYEELIAALKAEREVVERVEALDIPQSLRVVAKEISDEGHNGWGNHLTSTADNLETALEQP